MKKYYLNRNHFRTLTNPLPLNKNYSLQANDYNHKINVFTKNLENDLIRLKKRTDDMKKIKKSKELVKLFPSYFSQKTLEVDKKHFYLSHCKYNPKKYKTIYKSYNVDSVNCQKQLNLYKKKIIMKDNMIDELNNIIKESFKKLNAYKQENEKLKEKLKLSYESNNKKIH